MTLQPSPRADERTIKRRVHDRLVAGEPGPFVAGEPMRSRLRELLLDEAPLLAPSTSERILAELADEVSGLGPLEPLLADPTVSEVMVNGPGRAYVERHGALRRVEIDLDADAIVRIVQRVVAPLGLRLDRSSPLVDARLADGSRLHAVIPPLAVDGPCFTIRRFSVRTLALDDFALDAAARRFLRWAVVAGWNLLVSGGTGSGKTTLLNALSVAIPAAERVVSIEDTAELALEREHVVRLEARTANAEGVGEVTVRTLVRAALRMRPDRLVIGEVRGPEALDMLQALNTGHDGSLCTIHANGPGEALTRLETLALMAGAGLPLAAIRAQIAATIDAIVHVTRGAAGVRRVEAIAEVGRVSARDESAAVRPLFAMTDGRLVATTMPVRPPRRSVGAWSHAVSESC